MYISFSPTNSKHSLAILSTILNTVLNWLSSNRLTDNPSKTEYLLIGTTQQRSKIAFSTITFQNTTLSPTDSARNLGFMFDSQLSHEKQIASVCRTSFHHIRQLRQIRSSLDTSSAIVLANSLVSSRLDYCNSLYYGLPDSSLYKLQRVQNALARVVYANVKRHHHITPILRKLHWLPIKERILFKIATLTFTTLKNQLPSYMFNLLTRHNPSRSLRSIHQHKLVCPRIDSADGRRSFSYAAPTTWNSLPLHLRSLDAIDTFRSHLKTHLFPTSPT